LESCIRALVFLLTFTLQSIQRKITPPIVEELSTQSSHIILKNNYVFFANIWLLPILFPLQIGSIALQLYEKWPSSSSLNKMIHGEEQQLEGEQQQEEEQNSDGVYSDDYQ